MSVVLAPIPRHLPFRPSSASSPQSLGSRAARITLLKTLADSPRPRLCPGQLAAAAWLFSLRPLGYDGRDLSGEIDERADLPCDRAGGRRRHAHALGAAEGAARGGGPLAAGACAGGRARRPAVRGPRWWSGPTTRRSRPRRARSCPRRRSSCRRSGAAPRMRCWRREAAIERGADDILVIFGDTPLIRPQTLRRLRAALADGAAVAVLGFRPADPTGYGRLVTRGRRARRASARRPTRARASARSRSAMAG